MASNCREWTTEYGRSTLGESRETCVLDSCVGVGGDYYSKRVLVVADLNRIIEQNK